MDSGLNVRAIELLERILAELQGLPAAIAAVSQQAPQSRISSPDCAALEQLLPAIDVGVADRAFTVNELMRHAELPTQANLKAALAKAGGARRLGRLLRRGDGVPVDGLQVVCVGEANSGLLWVVKVVEKG